MRAAPFVARSLIVMLALASATASQPSQVGAPNLPALPPYNPRSGHTTILDADRQVVHPSPSRIPAGWGTATLVQEVIPEWMTNTGVGEPIEYQLPGQYNDGGPPHPMLVAWHGFGSSAASVAAQTTLDEECNARRWVYLSITGLDDKLFGPPISQRHVDVAIEWMLDRFNVDRDRICMVGFSMGAGAAMNYTARHRDPDGIMIAAVGAIAGNFDWQLTWNIEPLTRPWLEHAFNFGGPPGEQLFRYQQASSLIHDPDSYPPYPGEIQPIWSMATNLGLVPVYLAWDSGDPMTYLPGENQQFISLLEAQGTPVTSRVVVGTVDPLTRQPAAHSWAVLDENELMDVFEAARLDRRPRDLLVQVD
jgi:dienelactone hydrolase